MKQLFTTLFFLSTIQYGWSQMDLKPRITVQKTDTLLYKGRPYFVGTSRFSSNDSLRFSHSIPGGSVYILPRDGMPCLMPNTSMVKNMPVKNLPGDNSMPNGYRPIPQALLPFLKKRN